MPINFPSPLSHPAVVEQHTHRGGPPPPPPQAPESFWGSGKVRANWGRRVRGAAEEIVEPVECSTLQEFTGFQLIGAFLGAQRVVTESPFAVHRNRALGGGRNTAHVREQRRAARRFDKERRATLAYLSFPFSGCAAVLRKRAVLCSSPVDLPGAIRAPSTFPFFNKQGK